MLADRSPTPRRRTLRWAALLALTALLIAPAIPSAASTADPAPLPAGYLPEQAACLPTFVTDVYVGPHPRGAAAGSLYAYAALHDDHAMARVNTATNLLVGTTPGPGDGANGIALTQGKVFMAHRDSASVAVFDATSGAYLTSLGVGLQPFGVAATSDRVFVANFGSGTVSVINAVTNAVIATPNVGGYPTMIATMGSRAYVANFGTQAIAVLNASGAIEATIGGLDLGLFGIAANPSTNRLYVGSQNTDRIQVIDAATHLVLANIPMPSGPYALAVNWNTNRVFAVLADIRRLAVISGATNTWIDQLVLPWQHDEDGTNGGQGLAVTNNRIYVGNYAVNTLWVFDESNCAPPPTAVTFATVSTASPRDGFGAAESLLGAAMWIAAATLLAGIKMARK